MSLTSPFAGAAYGDDEFTDIEMADIDDAAVTVSESPSPSPDALLKSQSEDASDAANVELAPADGARDAAADSDAAQAPVEAKMAEALALAARLREHAADVDGLDNAELGDHVEFYQRAHTDLQRALSDVDQR